ncbi:9716_t:CDS:2, partial [Scutellospora calospora]
NVPLRSDESLDILEILKLAVCTFDQNAITLGSTRSYKSSNYLRVETKCNEKVPREMASQAALLELIATGSIPKLKKHFEQIFKYADQLFPQEVWVVHFSREDSIVLDSYWPSDELQKRGLNVVHFWHDKEFKNVRMSSRFRDAT